MNRAVFTLRNVGDRPTPEVTVAGEIDVSNADDFAQSVGALPGARPIILELSRLQYLDSAGFAALDRLLAQGTAVVVISPESLVHKAAELINLPFHHDAETARQVLQQG